MINILGIGAVIGGMVGVTAYVPQIIHLIKVKDSIGMSVTAWFIWIFGEILAFLYAISIKSLPFIIINVLYILADIIIIILIFRYEKKR